MSDISKKVTQVGCGMMSCGCLLCLVPLGVIVVLAVLGAVTGAVEESMK